MDEVALETKFAEALKGTEHLKGEVKIREVKARVNQNVFRQIVLANYNSKCAVSGIDIPDLLVASHIMPWSKNENERLNPENGICLSPLYDRAFDKGYIGISLNHEILLSSHLKKKKAENYYKNIFGTLLKSKLLLPTKYYPKKEFLQYHLDTIFKK
jgi:putative restriction endonuclease